jgi:hypothetical protein
LRFVQLNASVITIDIDVPDSRNSKTRQIYVLQSHMFFADGIRRFP